MTGASTDPARKPLARSVLVRGADGRTDRRPLSFRVPGACVRPSSPTWADR